MPKIKLTAPVIGIDQLSDETSLLVGEDITAVREALNVDIDRNGNVGRRVGANLQKAGSVYHSLYPSKRGWLFCCHKEELGFYTPSTATFTSLVSMNDYYRTSYAELNGNVYAFNPTFSCYFPLNSAVAHNVGIPLPSTVPQFAASPTGNLDPGTYGVTYSIVAANGEESGTGEVVTVELPNGGGIQGTFFEVLSGDSYRIYMTTANGEEFYQAVEFEANTASFLIVEHEEGRQPRTLNLVPLPYGHIVRAYNSRLFVASTGFVYFSRSFQPHLHNAAHDFIPTTGFTTMVEPVDGGVFIGDQRGVRFYVGDDPTSFEERETSHEVPIYGASTVVPGEMFDAELGLSADKVAVWLTISGFNAGRPDGGLMRFHTKQVKLPRYIQGCITPHVQKGIKQVITAVNSNVIASDCVAEDSVLSG